MARKVRADRVGAAKAALSAMPKRAAALAKAKAAGTGRTFATSGQRARSMARTGGR